MADGYKGKKKVIFRRVKGRIVPMKVSDKFKKEFNKLPLEGKQDYKYMEEFSKKHRKAEPLFTMKTGAIAGAALGGTMGVLSSGDKAFSAVGASLKHRKYLKETVRQASGTYRPIKHGSTLSKIAFKTYRGGAGLKALKTMGKWGAVFGGLYSLAGAGLGASEVAMSKTRRKVSKNWQGKTREKRLKTIKGWWGIK